MTNINVEVTEKKVTVKFRYDPQIVRKVNRFGLGMNFNKATRSWTHQNTWMFRRMFERVFPKEYKIFFYNYNEEKSIDSIGEILGKEEKNNLLLHEKLMEHQKQGVLNAIFKKRRLLFNWDCGVGKTFLMLEIIRQLLILGEIERALIICPISIIEAAWMQDNYTFTPNTKIINLCDVKKKKYDIKTAVKENNVSIINFESFWRIIDDLKGLFDLVIIDESSKIKNYKAKVTTEVIKFCDEVKRIYLLSGLPAPNHELEYFPQARIINPLYFGLNFYAFRERFFYNCNKYNYKLRKEKEEEFKENLSKIMVVIKKDDVLDLPPYTINRRMVYLDPNERKAYEKMKKELVLEIRTDKKIIAKSAAIKIMKLREGASGFFIYKDEFDNEEIHSFGKSKLNELEQFINELGKQQLIVWYFFRYEGDIISELLEKKDISYVRADGAVKDKRKMIMELKEFVLGERRILIANPASIAYGYTFINCSNVVYFSQSHSHELKKQSFERTYRKGQTKNVNYYYFIAENTIDIPIYNCLQAKADLNEEMVNYIKSL